MLTDPALDAGRHEFEMRTLLGRVLPPEENLKFLSENGWIPPVREIYPLVIGSMSFGALSPTMWEGLQMGVTYLNEVLQDAGAHLHRRGRVPAPAAPEPVPEVRHPPDRVGVFRVGRDHPRHSPYEGRSLRRGDQVRPGRQARRRRVADVVQGQQTHRRHPRRAHGRQPAQPPHPPDPVFHRGGRGQDDPVHVHGLGVPGSGLPEDLRPLPRPWRCSTT